LRVVVDKGLGLRRSSRLVATLADGPVLVVCGPDVSSGRRAEVESWGVLTEEAVLGDERELDPVDVCRRLASRGVQNALLEGGPTLAGAWWAAGLVDKIAAFVCPVIVAGRAQRGPLLGSGAVSVESAASLREVEMLAVGHDVLVTGYAGAPF
jgi:diaminohydroxyphosphoribosylaminopyrimidine deaminase/5-amino-6-(5-phosphoribosylamino)uracil reductase